MPRRKFDAWAVRPTSRVALIGASGWIGRALTDRVLAAGLPADRLRVFTRLPCALAVGSVEVQTLPLTDATTLSDGEWLVLHAGIIGAALGSPPAEVRRLNDVLLANVLGLADSGQVRRLVLISSGAAHRPGEGGPAKAAYSQMKRDHEAVVTDWAKAAGSAALLPRVFNLGGPYITHPQNYALGDFILSQARHGRISIGSGEPVIRDFTHVLDLAGALLDMAVDEAEGPEPFDIGGGEAVELGDLAQLVAAAFGVETPVIDRPAPAGGLGDRYVGDGRRYQAALAQAGQTAVPLPDIVVDTVAYLRQTGALSPAG
ncbi:MAG: NAD-dependent epimerase/dehydratase [Caulobacteraceae bacterium]|nr:NAD-dependent epimerase/dehydratase [Caulobacteraceae bacterium]